MVRKMADRPVRGVRWKQRHVNGKQLCRVFTGSVAYWLHVASFQAVGLWPRSQSHARSENRCIADYFICQDLQTHKQEAADAHGSLSIHSQQAGMHIYFH